MPVAGTHSLGIHHYEHHFFRELVELFGGIKDNATSGNDLSQTRCFGIGKC